MDTTRPCSIPDCDRDASGYKGGGRGWCSTHYMRWRRHGDPNHGGPIMRQVEVGEPCAIPDCTDPVIARGWCENHYSRWKRHRDPLAGGVAKGLDPVDRFWEKVDKTDACWLWTGPLNNGGYGSCFADGKTWMAHRYAWTIAGIALTPGLELDHLCRTRRCVRPDHLEEVTGDENKRRARLDVS